MSDTHTNVLVRMPVEVKGQLQREALLQDKSLTAEIVSRLRDSLARTDRQAASASNHNDPPLRHSYTTADIGTPAFVSEAMPIGSIPDAERDMLSIFRALPYEKQLALLSLFK